MATDTKTISVSMESELDDILWIEEEISKIGQSGYDPTIGLLSILKSVDKRRYSLVMLEMEKIIKEVIGQLHREDQKLFRDKIKELQPSVKCTLLANKSMKWTGRYTTGITSDNWIVWHTPRKDSDEEYFRFIEPYATKTLETTRLYGPTGDLLIVDARQLQTVATDEKMRFISQFRLHFNQFVHFVCNGVIGLVDEQFNSCEQAELKLVKQFIYEHQCGCVETNGLYPNGYIDVSNFSF